MLIHVKVLNHPSIAETSFEVNVLSARFGSFTRLSSGFTVGHDSTTENARCRPFAHPRSAAEVDFTRQTVARRCATRLFHSRWSEAAFGRLRNVERWTDESTNESSFCRTIETFSGEMDERSERARRIRHGFSNGRENERKSEFDRFVRL